MTTPKNGLYNIGVVGSTGAVGEVVLEILEQRSFPVGELRLFTSEKSQGTAHSFKGKTYHSLALDDDSFKGLDFCIFSAGSSVSLKHAQRCADAGCIVIDNTSAFRMDKSVPLVVPEVNPGDLSYVKVGKGGIIANPNCSTIQMVVVLSPILATYGLTRVIVSTYQSTSGAGKKAMEELSAQVVSLFNNQEVKRSIFPHQIAFNCIPQIDVFEENGYTKEEMKMINETRKILHQPDLAVTATTVRVPTFTCHSESVYIETEDEVDIEELKDLLAESPGIVVLDDPEKGIYPVPFSASGRDEVFVGRIRRDLSNPNGINLWIVSDNLRKGAALNAVQIAEQLIQTLQ
jgi:aspartate-semialdehyde dehydrogenase